MTSVTSTMGAEHLNNSVEDASIYDQFDPPCRGWYIPCKTTVEWVTALGMLIVLAPVTLVLAAVVKFTSPGPAFYTQTRLGRYGRPFRIFKLRSMTHNCEATSGAVWAAHNDPRITGFGRFLRRTHLDEIPQLLNVLRGDMALIGPRPERPEFVSRLERAIPNYRGRLMVRPGVTGLAQMRLPSDSDLEGVRRKVAHDLYYVREVGLALDLRIAVSTVFLFSAEALACLCKMVVESHGREIETASDYPAAANGYQSEAA